MATDSRFRRKRSWFFWGETITYEADGAFSKGSISEGIVTLTASLFSHAVPETIRDVSGVNDEVLLIEGTCGLSSKQTDKFRFRLKSSFRETTKDHHMVSALNEERNGELSSDLPLSELGAAIPLLPSLVRLTIKIYKPKRFIGILGFMPTEIGELNFKISSEGYSISFRCLMGSKTGEIPFNKSYLDEHSFSVLEAVRRTIEKISNFDIVGDIGKNL